LFLLAYGTFQRREGELIALLLTIYPAMRFLEECIRTDEAGIFGTGMTISQNVSLILLAIAAGLWLRLFRGAKPQSSRVTP
jgi:prolipoprotein diacylglyceryltransferase